MHRLLVKLRDEGRQLKIGKFPYSASGRALAAGDTEGVVKLIFDAKYGELLGVHMIGENVTELLAELVLARNLEATEDEIIEAMQVWCKKNRPEPRIVPDDDSTLVERALRQHKLQRKYVSLHPQVFTPTGHAPYFVALGNPSNETTAMDLRNRARQVGLPRDTYARNF